MNQKREHLVGALLFFFRVKNSSLYENKNIFNIYKIGGSIMLLGQTLFVGFMYVVLFGKPEFLEGKN